MVKTDSSKNLALHLFDQALLVKKLLSWSFLDPLPPPHKNICLLSEPHRKRMLHASEEITKSSKKSKKSKIG